MIPYSKWLELSLSDRIKLSTRYGIIKKGSTHVFGNNVISDGFDIKDVESVLSLIHSKHPNVGVDEVLVKEINTDHSEVIVPKKTRAKKNG